MFSKSFQKYPPGSGVPVPGTKLGSNQSKSNVIYIGDDLNFDNFSNWDKKWD